MVVVTHTNVVIINSLLCLLSGLHGWWAQVVLPPGYLQAVYAIVRDAGGKACLLVTPAHRMRSQSQ